eukprot:365671-Chlamydomonas_euryale.AAC.4
MPRIRRPQGVYVHACPRPWARLGLGRRNRPRPAVSTHVLCTHHPASVSHQGKPWAPHAYTACMHTCMHACQAAPAPSRLLVCMHVPPQPSHLPACLHARMYARMRTLPRPAAHACLYFLNVCIPVAAPVCLSACTHACAPTG